VIHDASMATTTTTFRTANGMPNPDYINTIIPAKRNIICLIAKNSPIISTHHIFARNAAELDVQLSGLYQPKTYNLTVSANKVQFETLAPESVKIYSVNGQLVKSIISGVGKNSITLDKGVYIIRIGDKTAKVLL
jgi:hypothetical protein